MDSVDRMPVSSSTEESLAMTVSFADAVGSALSVYTDSKFWKMTGNDITVEAASTLAACIAAKLCLAKLNLTESELKDEGAILISKALKERLPIDQTTG
ncbi:hypothetical protein AAG906_019404 [Vitis piasezkii]